MEIDKEYKEFMDSWLFQTARFMEKVMVFIDAAYMHKCLEDQFGRADIDLIKFIRKLLRGRQLLRSYYYTAEILQAPDDRWKTLKSDQQKTFTALAHLSYIEVRKGKLQFSNPGVPPRQKGVDVLLALDMLRFALKGNYDTAILVSGDGDFADIVRMIKDEGRKVDIITFPGTCAKALREASDELIEIDSEFLRDCWMEKGEKEEKTSK